MHYEMWSFARIWDVSKFASKTLLAVQYCLNSNAFSTAKSSYYKWIPEFQILEDWSKSWSLESK